MAQRLLERAILDYMSKRGFHHAGAAFSQEILANQNIDAINSPCGAFLQVWWDRFYETYTSKFSEVPIFATESFDQVAHTIENVVTNNGPTNQSCASDHTAANMLPIMESNSPDHTEDWLSNLLLSDMPLFIKNLEINEMNDMLPFESNDVLPNVAVQSLQLLAPTSSGDFFRMLPQAKLGENMLGDANKRTLENLPVGQQITFPSMRSGRKRKAPMSSLTSVERYNATTAGFNATTDNEARQEGMYFEEIHKFHETKSKLLCCHFNSEGNLLAAAGQDGMVLICDVSNNNVNSGEVHAHCVTDVRFRPNSTVFATSSFDKTMKIWEASKSNYLFRDLVEHVEQVTSIDFHPTEVDLISFCDTNDEIRLWDINMGDCKLILKGGSKQVRFQPQFGKFLASSTTNIINIFDVETNTIYKKLQGHVKDVCSFCWDMSGNYLASVSEDNARIWSVSEGKCIFELFSNGNTFQSCTFRPGYSQVLMIGSDKLLEHWNPIYQSNKTWAYSGHTGLISSLADSPSEGIVASASDDQVIKIWR
ncbi:hypothetical protein HAX54_031002 [Datura stramonium]|uniref:Uncharacterized protein n=1 Tax=Datura stramonium TaxID=4076 RepID=A0ABS8RL54_DATST|nr:hypothetical protein [Datura stramonium]